MADIQPSSTFSPALPTGITLGPYNIRKVIGSGGFGITYLAQEEGTDKLFVIKENYPVEVSFRNMTSLTVGPSGESRKESYDWALTRFLNEAKILSSLSHPNIVPIQKAFKALGTAYYVMPHVEGKELSQAAPAPDIISAEWLQPILEKILSALVYLHGKGLIHRDIKPNNILLRADDEPILIDFGTARALESTHSHTHIGTPGYMPLEQLAGKGKRGPWTDIYALGATCYRLITGKVPPHAMDRMEEDEYFPLVGRPSLEGRFPEHFLRSIDKALLMDRSKRWQSAQEWLEALEIKPATPSGDATPANEAKPASPKKKKALIISFILLFVTLCCGGLFYPHIRLMTMGISAEQYDATLCIAAHYGDSEKVRLLLAAGADVNKDDEYGRTPLCEAINEGQTECLKLLLAAPEIDVNKANARGNAPLRSAAASGRTDYVRLLLAAPGITVNNSESLYMAALNGHTECVRLLLEVPGIDVNRSTPLCSAANNGHVECVKLLLAAPGIDVNKADAFGRTPLSLAAYEGHTNCLNALLAVPGIDVSAFPPLSLAVMANDPTKIRELLADGADPNQNDNLNNCPPLYYAAGCDYADCVLALLSAPGIDVNRANPHGWTPLNWAAYNGRTECVRALLTALEINVNLANKYNHTPLYWARRNNHTECAELIREAGGR